MMDFKAIGAAAIGSADSLIPAWLPDGRRRGREWVARNPCRADTKPGSFSVNLTTGKWADFACGDKGGDLISLKAYLENSSQGEAAGALARDLGLAEVPRCAASRSQVSRPTPAAQTPPPTTEPSFNHRQHGEPSRTWAYRDAAGNMVGYACRFDLGTGKAVLPLSWVAGAWRWKAMPDPRPLYNLPEIHNRSDLVVIVAEGEKAADAVDELLPDAVATTWPGGCKAWDRVDWSPLKGRRVILWPDADETGVEAMEGVRRHLLAIGAARVKTMILPEGLPKGWDAADALGDEWSSDEVLELLAGQLNAPEGLCLPCWRNRIAAPVGGPTCPHAEYTFPQNNRNPEPAGGIADASITSEEAYALGYSAYWDGHGGELPLRADSEAAKSWEAGYRAGEAEAAEIYPEGSGDSKSINAP